MESLYISTSERIIHHIQLITAAASPIYPSNVLFYYIVRSRTLTKGINDEMDQSLHVQAIRPTQSKHVVSTMIPVTR